MGLVCLTSSKDRFVSLNCLLESAVVLGQGQQQAFTGNDSTAVLSMVRHDLCILRPGDAFQLSQGAFLKASSSELIHLGLQVQPMRMPNMTAAHNESIHVAHSLKVAIKAHVPENGLMRAVFHDRIEISSRHSASCRGKKKARRRENFNNRTEENPLLWLPTLRKTKPAENPNFQ